MLHPNHELLVEPDLELELIPYLTQRLNARSEEYTNDVFVSNKLPRDFSEGDRAVTVRVNGGGGTDDLVYNGALVVNVFAEDDVVVFSLAALISGLLRLAPLYCANITSVDSISSAIPVDEESQSGRVFQNFIVTAKMTAL